MIFIHAEIPPSEWSTALPSELAVAVELLGIAKKPNAAKAEFVTRSSPSEAFSYNILRYESL